VAGVVLEQQVIVPAGEYLARIAAVDEQIVRGRYATWRQMFLRWSFEIAAGDHAGRSLTGWTGIRFARGSHLYSWVRAAFNAEIGAGYALDTKELVGRRVLARVKLLRDPATGEWHNLIAALLPWPDDGEAVRSGGA
jgi:hypothetical protein